MPRLASVLCALGGLLSDLRHELATSFVSPLATLDRDARQRGRGAAKGAGLATLEAEAVAPRDRELQLSADLRYVGQFRELDVPLPDDRFGDASWPPWPPSSIAATRR